MATDEQTFDLALAPVGAWLPPPLDTESPDIDLWRDNDGKVCAYGGSLDGMCWMHLPGVATFRFSLASPQITAIADASATRGAIVDAYYRTLLPLALQARGTEVLHASAVRIRGRVVALCGIKETGKSTIAYALSQRGYSLCADDAVPFTTSSDVVHALRLPFTIRLRPSSVAFFKTNRMREKQCPARDAQTRVALTPERLGTIFVLQRNPPGLSTASPSVSRLTASSAFVSALTHGYCFSLRDQSQRARMVRNYLDLAAKVPVFEVRFGAGLKWLPAITSAIEETIMATAE